MDLRKNTKYLIETPDGFVPFLGVSKTKKECIKITLDGDLNIKCSSDHPFIINDEIIRANTLKIGDCLQSKYGLKHITNIEAFGEQDCYDVVNAG